MSDNRDTDDTPDSEREVTEPTPDEESGSDVVVPAEEDRATADDGFADEGDDAPTHRDQRGQHNPRFKSMKSKVFGAGPRRSHCSGCFQ